MDFSFCNNWLPKIKGGEGSETQGHNTCQHHHSNTHHHGNIHQWGGYYHSNIHITIATHITIKHKNGVGITIATYILP